MPLVAGEVDARPLVSSLFETNFRNVDQDRTNDDTFIVTSEVVRKDSHSTSQIMERDDIDIDSDSGSTSTSESFLEFETEECFEFSQSIHREYDRNLLQLSTDSELLNPINFTPKACVSKKSALSIRWASPLEEIKAASVMKDETFGSISVMDHRSLSSSCSDGEALSVTFVPAVAGDKFLTSDAYKIRIPPSKEFPSIFRNTQGNKTQIYFVPSCDSGDDLSIDCDSPIAAAHSEIDPYSHWPSKTHLHPAHERHVHTGSVYRHHQVGLWSVLALIAASFVYSNAFLTRCSVSAHMINFIYSMMDVETRTALQRSYYRHDVRHRRMRPATFLDANQNAIGVWLFKAA
jgi:hypothetical protein